jgi:single-strand DNA-binding protein
VIGFNESIQAGYLTKDPQLDKVITGDGEEVSRCRFTIAVNRPGKAASETKADFVPVVAWREMGENVAKYKKKGEPLLVKGELRYSSWEAEDGSRRSRVILKATHIQYLPSARSHARWAGRAA